MKSLKEPQLEKQTVSRLKSELVKLKQEYAQVCKLLNLAKPADLPALVPQSESSNKSKLLPVFGKKKKIQIEKPVIAKPEQIQNNDDDDNEEEVEEEVNENEKTEKAVDESKTVDVLKEPEDIKSKEVVNPVKKSDDEVKMEISSKGNSSIQKKPKSTDKKQSEKVKKSVPKQYPKEGFSDDYNMWVPPSNQTGDGRTSLNDKLGY